MELAFGRGAGGEGFPANGKKRIQLFRLPNQRNSAMKRKPRSDPGNTRRAERIDFARTQRKQANEFANCVWQMLRASRMRSQKFRREHPIGPYTVDFVCLGLKLVIEVDGRDHLTNDGIRRDKTRDHYLAVQGFEVVRIPGYQVTKDASSVQRTIEQAVDHKLRCSPLSPSPSPPNSGQAPLDQNLGERGARMGDQ